MEEAVADAGAVAEESGAASGGVDALHQGEGPKCGKKYGPPVQSEVFGWFNLVVDGFWIYVC